MMKRMVALCTLFVLAACGPGEPLVTKPAAEMNLLAKDLGESFALYQDQDLGLERIFEQIESDEAGATTDANRRTFLSLPQAVTGTQAVTRTMVVAAVIVFNSAGSAQSGMAEARQGVVDKLKKNHPDLELTTLTAPTVGDQAELVGGKVPGRPDQVYLLSLRKANVVGLIVTAGPPGLAQEWVAGLGQKMAEKIPAPAAKP